MNFIYPRQIFFNKIDSALTKQILPSRIGNYKYNGQEKMEIKSIRFKSGRQTLVWGREPTQQALINLHSYNAERIKEEVVKRKISRNLLINQVLADYFNEEENKLS